MKRIAKSKKIVAKTRPSPKSPARGTGKASGAAPRPIERNKRYDALLSLRNQIVSMVRNISASTLTSTKQAGEELADIGSDNFSREIGLAMMTEDGRKLAMIQEALERLAAGTYGTCSECGKKISEARLNALPYADFCVDCQTLQEEQEKMSQLSPMEFALFQEQEMESKEGEGDEEASEGDEEQEEAATEEGKAEKAVGEKAPAPSNTPPTKRGKARPSVRPAEAQQPKAATPAPAVRKTAKPAPARPLKVKTLPAKARTKAAPPHAAKAKAAKKPTRPAPKPAKSPAKRVKGTVVKRAKAKVAKTVPARKTSGHSGKRSKK